MIDELDDLILTIRLAIAFNPLSDPNELLKATLVRHKLKEVQLQILAIQWVATGKPYDHFRTFIEALAGDIATSDSYPGGSRTI